jgi:branched-chain amino acid transport system substrate-binding protein
MHIRKIVLLAATASLGAFTSAGAQSTPLRIGMVYSYTGSSADAGPVVDAAMNAWLAQHKGMMSGRKVEIIKRDDTGVAPDVAKRLATELIVQN